jgi:hypothetical protein
VVGGLLEAQRKVLEELRQLVQEALNKHEFSAPPSLPKEEEEKEEEEEKAPPILLLLLLQKNQNLPGLRRNMQKKLYQ